MPSISAVDLFCGVGGLTHGLERAGISVKLGVDIDPSCYHPFERNNKGKFLCADVGALSAETIKGAFDAEGVRLLAGCAPCQPFSTYSRSVKRDPENKSRRPRRGGDDWTLVRRFGNLVKEVGPDLVTMENVPPLADNPIFAELLELLGGYHVDYKIVDCRKIGLAQSRERLVLVASRLGPIEIPNYNLPRRTVREAIGDLKPLEAGGRDPDDAIHCSSRLSALNLKRILASKPGGTWRDWPEELRTACHKKLSGATYPSVYGRMEWGAPSPTITTQCFGYGNGRFGHPEQNRAISLREAAMLQGFPREYSFVAEGAPVSFATLGRLIGNAVPVALSEAIGKLLVDHVRGICTAETRSLSDCQT